MQIREYFMKGLEQGLHKKRQWMNCLFSVVYNINEFEHHYDYRLYKDEQGLFFFVPGSKDQKEYIEGYKEDVALLHFRDEFILQPNELINYTGPGPLKTCYGNVFVNHLCLILPFGSIFPFQAGLFNLGKIESEILTRLIDDPPGNEDPLIRAPDGKIYVSQYLMFSEHILTLPAYSDGLVTATTKKSLMASPDRNRVRDKWIADNPERLTDPAAIAELSNVLKKLDDEYLSGDESEEFYRSKKKLEGARKKVHYMFGGESAFSDGTKVELIAKSLEEGIDMDKLPVMFNSLRAGSYNRGKQTALGGESTKTIYRMVGTARIVEHDCGTHIGVPTVLYPFIAKDLVGYSMVKDGKTIVLTPELLQQNMFKTIDVRGPMACKTGRDVDKGILGKGKNICAVCAGSALAENPNGIPAAAAGVGGRFLSLFLAKMHATVLRTVQWNMESRIT
ncbi:hypothetical protein D3C87_1051640 [compost metagenome]